MSCEDFPPAATLRQDDTLLPKEPRLSSSQAAVYASTNRFLPCGRKTPNQEHRPPYTPMDAPSGTLPRPRTPLPEHRTARCPARTLRIYTLGSKDSRHRRGNLRMLRHTQIGPDRGKTVFWAGRQLCQDLLPYTSKAPCPSPATWPRPN